MKLSLGERIRVLRERRRMTQAELAGAAGLKQRSHIAKIEGGEIAIPEDATLDAIAAALGVTPPYLWRDDEDSAQSSRGDDGFQMIDFTSGLSEVPVVAEVACGEPMDYSVEGETALIRADAAPNPQRHEFLIRARGDSMVEYGIHDGWYVVVEARPGGVAASGELVIAWYEPSDKSAPGGITLKRWFRHSGRKILKGSSEETTFELKEGDIFELKGIVRRAFPPAIHFPKISG